MRHRHLFVFQAVSRDDFLSAMHSLCGDATFSEAFKRTGRHVSLTIATPASAVGMRRHSHCCGDVFGTGTCHRGPSICASTDSNGAGAAHVRSGPSSPAARMRARPSCEASSVAAADASAPSSTHTAAEPSLASPPAPGEDEPPFASASAPPAAAAAAAAAAPEAAAAAAPEAAALPPLDATVAAAASSYCVRCGQPASASDWSAGLRAAAQTRLAVTLACSRTPVATLEAASDEATTWLHYCHADRVRRRHRRLDHAPRARVHVHVHPLMCMACAWHVHRCGCSIGGSTASSPPGRWREAAAAAMPTRRRRACCARRRAWPSRSVHANTLLPSTPCCCSP